VSHYGNKDDFRAARRRRNEAYRLAHRRGLRIALVIDIDPVPRQLIWNALSHIQETRGIRVLQIDQDSYPWPDLADWRTWYRVDVSYTRRELLFDVLRPDGVIALGEHPFAARAQHCGIPVWQPSNKRHTSGNCSGQRGKLISSTEAAMSRKKAEPERLDVASGVQVPIAVDQFPPDNEGFAEPLAGVADSLGEATGLPSQPAAPDENESKSAKEKRAPDRSA
jgi:hypothetical protein